MELEQGNQVKDQDAATTIDSFQDQITVEAATTVDPFQDETATVNPFQGDVATAVDPFQNGAVALIDSAQDKAAVAVDPFKYEIAEVVDSFQDEVAAVLDSFQDETTAVDSFQYETVGAVDPFQYETVGAVDPFQYEAVTVDPSQDETAAVRLFQDEAATVDAFQMKAERVQLFKDESTMISKLHSNKLSEVCPGCHQANHICHFSCLGGTKWSFHCITIPALNKFYAHYKDGRLNESKYIYRLTRYYIAISNKISKVRMLSNSISGNALLECMLNTKNTLDSIIMGYRFRGSLIEEASNGSAEEEDAFGKERTFEVTYSKDDAVKGIADVERESTALDVAATGLTRKNGKMKKRKFECELYTFN